MNKKARSKQQSAISLQRNLAEKETPVDEALPDFTIERLRASKERAEHADRCEGYDAGILWAEREAEFTELKKLVDAMAARDYRQSIFRDWQVDNASGYLFLASVYSQEEARELGEEFWLQYTDTNTPSFEFVEAFASGAETVFERFEEA